MFRRVVKKNEKEKKRRVVRFSFILIWKLLKKARKEREKE